MNIDCLTMVIFLISVRKSTNSSSTNRQVDNHLNSRTSVSPRSKINSNLVNTNDVNQQKENKFKQIFDQSTVDLSKRKFLLQKKTRFLFHKI
jgi:hypothetical protein